MFYIQGFDSLVEGANLVRGVSRGDPWRDGLDLREGLFWTRIIKTIPVEKPHITSSPLFSPASFNSVKWVLLSFPYLVWVPVWCFANVHSCTFRGPLFLSIPTLSLANSEHSGKEECRKWVHIRFRLNCVVLPLFFFSSSLPIGCFHN